MKMIFLVDGDNNIGTGLKGMDMLSEQDTVLIFYQKGLALTKIKKLCAASRADVQYVESVKGGKNSIDFQIITELGVLVGKREADFAYVISQDKGYAASIEALRLRYADAFQEVALRPSVEECLHLSFVLKAANRRELNDGLIREYGAAQGQLLYNRLKEIFQAPEMPENSTEKQAAKVPATPAAKPRLPLRSRKKTQAKPQAAQQPAPQQAKAQATQQPAPQQAKPQVAQQPAPQAKPQTTQQPAPQAKAQTTQQPAAQQAKPQTTQQPAPQQAKSQVAQQPAPQQAKPQAAQ